MRSESIRAAMPTYALAAACAVIGFGALLATLHSSRLIGFTVLAGVLGVVGVLLSGNPRLSCLWGLLLTAPLDLSKRFMIVPHMGGEAAFRIELVDFFVLALVYFLVRDVLQNRRPRMRFPGVMLWWLAMAGMGAVTIGLGPLRTPAAHEVFRILKSLLLMFVLVNEVVRERQFFHAALALLAGVLLESVIGILQYTLNIRLGLQALGEASEETVDFLSRATLQHGEAVYRVGALIGHANLLAAYLALLLPIAIAMLFVRLSVPVKALIGLTIVLGEAALVATLSRAGWVAFAAGASAVVLLTWFHRRMRERYTLLRAGIVMGGVLMLLAFSGPISKRVFRSDPGAVSARVEWLETAWLMIQEKPLLGFGLNNYVFVQAPYTPQGSTAGLQRDYGDYWPVVHNVYALTWVEQGAIGLTLFLGMHVHVFVIGIRNLRTRSDLLYAINIGSLCGFGAIMVDGLASFYIRNPDCARMWWIVVSLIWGVHYWRRANETSPKSVGSSEAMR